MHSCLACGPGSPGVYSDMASKLITLQLPWVLTDAASSRDGACRASGAPASSPHVWMHGSTAVVDTAGRVALAHDAAAHASVNIASRMPACWR